MDLFWSKLCNTEFELMPHTVRKSLFAVSLRPGLPLEHVCSIAKPGISLNLLKILNGDTLVNDIFQKPAFPNSR